MVRAAEGGVLPWPRRFAPPAKSWRHPRLRSASRSRFFSGRLFRLGARGILPGTNPREPYPAPSGSWNVLFPWHDYPFDVVGQHDGDTDVPVTLTRDPLDATSTDGVKLLAQRRASVDVRRGDSGGPMFYGNRACGVISLVAGSVIGSNPTVWSELIYSQIRDVEIQLNATVVKS